MNNKVRNWMKSLPVPATILISIALIASFFVMLYLGGYILCFIPAAENWPVYGVELFSETIVALYAVLMIILLGYKRILVMKGVGFVRGFITAGFLVFMCAYTTIAMILNMKMQKMTDVLPATDIFLFAVTMLMIGIAEEGFYRGVVLNILYDRFPKTQKGIMTSIILSGVFFGAMHLMNYIAVGKWEPVIVQAITAGVLGAFYSVVYIQTGNLWIVIILHAWNDFAAFIPSGIFGQNTVVESIGNTSVMNLLAVFVYLIPCAILLRKSNLNKMVSRANGVEILETKQSIRNMSILSLVLGISSIVLSIAGISVGIGIVGILNTIYIRRYEKNSTLSFIGMICSISGIVLCILVDIFTYLVV